MTNLEPLSPHSLHVVIDMQRLFAEHTAWHTPGLAGIIPAVMRLTTARPERTVFARFMVPPNAEAASRRWRTYYRHWASMTGDALPPGMLDLIEPLASQAADGAVFDKFTYSIFGASAFEARLNRERIDTLILTGVETDVCVLASVFDAVDRGYRVVVPMDAVASSSVESHRATIDLLFRRLSTQIDVWTVDEVAQAWRHPPRG